MSTGPAGTSTFGGEAAECIGREQPPSDAGYNFARAWQSTAKSEIGSYLIDRVDGTKAGDAIFFMNGAQTHGAVPWRGVNARRTVLFMYSARSTARQGASRWCLDPDRYWDADAVSGMTPEQRAVMYGPSSSPQTDGPYLDLDEDGVVKVDRDYLTSLETASDTFLRG